MSGLCRVLQQHPRLHAESADERVERRHVDPVERQPSEHPGRGRLRDSRFLCELVCCTPASFRHVAGNVPSNHMLTVACATAIDKSISRALVFSMTTRACNRCGEVKPLDDFRTVRVRSWSGPHSNCRDCERATPKRRIVAPTACSKCGEVRQPSEFAVGQGVCRKCARNRARRRSPESRQRDAAKEAHRQGKSYRTRAETRARTAERLAEQNARNVPTEASMRDQFRTLLRRLFAQRCAEVGESADTLRYAARWKSSSDFRARERQRQQQFKHAHPDAVARNGDRRKKRVALTADGTLTPRVVAALFAKASLCPYCAVDLDQSTMALDHMEPIARGGLHTLSNVVVCCRACNLEKRDLPYDQWLTRVRVRAGVADPNILRPTPSFWVPATPSHAGDARAQSSTSSTVFNVRFGIGIAD
jgi:hypothetical protein